MDSQTFNDVVERQLAQIKEVLVKKGEEYATEDRLHNFKTAAILNNETPRQALRGMMVKHTVSIYDMCNGTEEYSQAQWDEKITDHLNYLILLKAVVMEEVLENGGEDLAALREKLTRDSDGDFEWDRKEEVTAPDEG